MRHWQGMIVILVVHTGLCAGDESGFYVQDGTTVSSFPSNRKYHT